jgi:hypothetical protein
MRPINCLCWGYLTVLLEFEGTDLSAAVSGCPMSYGNCAVNKGRYASLCPMKTYQVVHFLRGDDDV